jgi:hypothetical protein
MDLRMRLLAILFVSVSLAGCARGFDSNAWRGGAGCADDRRLGMVSALERDVLRTGMSQTEVVSALGEPEIRAPDGLVYCLGRNFLDYDEYVIELGPDGAVTSFRQVQG